MAHFNSCANHQLDYIKLRLAHTFSVTANTISLPGVRFGPFARLLVREIAFQFDGMTN